jgi:dihydrofolate reductase
MRKIIVGAQVSMDGVMQAPGGPTEDPTNGFKFGGWAMSYFSQEGREEIDRVFKNFDLLLGRKTYEIFAAYWPYYDENSHGRIAKLFNSIKKYVVSRSGEVDTSWAGSLLLRDIADVKRLKQEDGPNLVTQGSTELVHAILSSRVSPNGLIVGHYEREGEIKIGDTALDSPSDREVARRERMKREG